MTGGLGFSKGNPEIPIQIMGCSATVNYPALDTVQCRSPVTVDK
jgi:hypothetical protein